VIYEECPYCFVKPDKHNVTSYEYDEEKKCYKGLGCDNCYGCGIIELPDAFYIIAEDLLGE